LESSGVRSGRNAEANFAKAKQRIGFVCCGIESECSAGQFVKCRRIVGKIMGSMLLDGVSVLSDDFPDLRPGEINYD
jgi:hypothetical protein